MFFYIVLTPISTTSGLWHTGNARKYHQIDEYIYQCVFSIFGTEKAALLMVCESISIAFLARADRAYDHSSIAIILMGKRELVALFTLSSWCLVMWAALPCGATGWSAVCACGISWSYSLTIFNQTQIGKKLAINCFSRLSVAH